MLETLRAKPHHIKQSIALFITIVIFSGILFVWFSSRDARSQEIQVRGKTVTPVDGVTSMFGGFFSGLKERIADTESSSVKVKSPVATSTDNFDLSGVVVVDSTASSTKTVSATTTKKK